MVVICEIQVMSRCDGEKVTIMDSTAIKIQDTRLPRNS